MKQIAKYHENNLKILQNTLKYFFLILFLISIKLQASGRISVNEILEKVIDNSNSIPPYAYRLENRMPVYNVNGIDAELYIRDVRSDGKRYDLVMTDYLIIKDQTNLSFNKRAIWTGKQYQYRQQSNSPDDKFPLAGVSSQKNYKNGMWDSPYNGSFLFGIVTDDMEHIAKILKDISSVSLNDDLEEIDGHLCYVIQGSKGNDKYKIWVDPNSGFNIRKAVSTVFDNEENIFIRCQLDNVKIEKIDDIYIPTSGKYSRTWEGDNNKEEGQVWEAKRSNIKFNPDFNAMGAFEMDLPDGTQVVDFDFESILYRWDKGKLVPDVEDAFIDIMDKQIKNMKSDVASESSGNMTLTIDEKNEPNLPADIAKNINKEIQFNNTIGTQNNKHLTFNLVAWIITGLLFTSIFAWLFLRKKFRGNHEI